MDRTISQDDILRSRSDARYAFSVLNDQGEGFDPTGEDSAWTLRRDAETTDDVSVYTHTDDDGDLWVILVGTDQSGSDDSRWAVRVGAVGVDEVL
jgi:hypothetical protein